MPEFWSDLLANTVGGIVAAALIAGYIRLRDRDKHKTLRDLTEIMGRAIIHRNLGERKSFADEKEWVNAAKAIEEEAVSKAKQLSTTAGSLVEWLDRVDSWDGKSEVDRYVSILSKVIERIRELMERNS